MSTSEAIATVAAVQSHHTVSNVDQAGAQLLVVVGDILSRGVYGVDDVEALRAIADDDTFDAADRRVARITINWLLQQSAKRPATIGQHRNKDAWH